MEKKKIKNKKSLRNRLIFAFLFIIFFTFCMFEISFSIGVKNFYYKSIEQSIIDRMNLNLKMYETYKNFDTLDKAAKYLIENTEIPNYIEAQILDKNANIILSNLKYSEKKKIDISFVKNVKDKYYVYVGKNPEFDFEIIMSISMPFYYNNGIGIMRYVTSLNDIDKIIYQYMIYSSLIGVFIATIAFIIAYKLSNTILEPIFELKKGVGRIVDNKFDIKVKKYDDDEIGELTDTFNYMVDEIKKTDKMKHDFISSISHELRTPITSISGWAETILSSDEFDFDETKMAFDIILKESKRLNTLVENLLDFSKLEANRIILFPSKFNLISFIREISNQIKPILQINNIIHIIGLPVENFEYNGDQNRLRQALINIYDNAVKYSKNGKIHTTLKYNDYYVVISIKDSGTGIAKEHLENITKDFYKVNVNNNGSGIGLAIVKKIIHLHGGKLSFKSELGKGTEVIISLPLKCTILEILE